jgi:hypothetical protein
MRVRGEDSCNKFVTIGNNLAIQHGAGEIGTRLTNPARRLRRRGSAGSWWNKGK